MDTNQSNIRQIRGFWNVAIQENVKNIMERTQNQWRSFTQDENQKIIIKYYQKKEMSIFWTYNKRKLGTTIADGRKDKW